MADNSTIEWTDATWNPVRGCSRVSPGCENCYAERVAARFSGGGQPYHGLAFMKLKTIGEDDTSARTVPRWTGRVRLVPEHLADPLKWRRPRRIFVNSMSDLFHENLSDDEIAAVFGVMAAAPLHTFQVLTKRAERMHAWFHLWASGLKVPDWEANGWQPQAWVCWDRTRTAAPLIRSSAWDATFMEVAHAVRWPLPNVWLGVSVEDQQRADERIPLLLKTPAAVRFVSAEPLLGPVDLRNIGARSGPVKIDALTGCWSVPSNLDGHARQEPRISWVIAGAESGPGARPMDLQWARALRDQCVAAGVPYFFKQDAERGKKRPLPVLDGRQWAEFPTPCAR